MRPLLLILVAAALQAAESSSTRALFDAIHSGDAGAVKKALAAGGKTDARDADGVPALMHAALFARADVMELLLRRGADVNAATGTGATALMWSVPDVPKVRLLLAHGADVKARSTNTGRTALLIAASYPGSVEIMRMLLDKGADLRAQDRNEDNALTMSASTGDVGNLKLLVERGLDVNFRGSGGALPLSRALTRTYPDGSAYLISRGAKFRPQDIRGMAHAQPVATIEWAIRKGVEINSRAKPFGRTAIIDAASSEDTGAATLKLLLEKGADPNIADDDGETALNWAMHRGDQAKIAVLKEHGAKEGSTRRNLSYRAPEGIADARTSVERSVALLQPPAPKVFKARACITCHSQSMPAQVVAAAREKGIAVNEDLARQNRRQIVATYKPFGEEAMQGVVPPGGDLTVGYIIMALAAEKYPLDRMSAALAHVTASRQMPDGSWIESTSRPPLEYSTISRTAMAVRTLVLYPIPGRQQEIDAKLRLAGAWLAHAQPKSAEEYAMRLMGLAWTKAPREEVRQAAQEWIAQQGEDGGWRQLPHIAPDAYATGITLYALGEAGIPVDHEAYRKGVRFLLANQYRDGSWFVRTRAFPVQPQMESGYPFGYNQWISSAGACWASLAIARTLPDRAGDSARR
jgi:ankyrin repeat protein